MNHSSLNLLAWRKQKVSKKLFTDSLCSVFLIGVLALIIEGSDMLMQAYVKRTQEQIKKINQHIYTHLAAEQKALQAEKIFSQLKQLLNQQKANQLCWQTVLKQLDELYQTQTENIFLNQSIWQEHTWAIEGFALKKQDLIDYQKQLDNQNFPLEVRAWYPHQSDNISSNFQLSEKI